MAIGVADKVIMLENAIYSILSPEGFASILWKDSSRVQEAANIMKLTAKDLYDMGKIDKILKEYIENEKFSVEKIAADMKEEIESFNKEYKKIDRNELLSKRYNKYRSM